MDKRDGRVLQYIVSFLLVASCYSYSYNNIAFSSSSECSNKIIIIIIIRNNTKNIIYYIMLYFILIHTYQCTRVATGTE